jgi:hypothetical protein
MTLLRYEGRSPVKMSIPSHMTVPPEGETSPLRSMSREVFPVPDAPTIQDREEGANVYVQEVRSSFAPLFRDTSLRARRRHSMVLLPLDTFISYPLEFMQ